MTKQPTQRSKKIVKTILQLVIFLGLGVALVIWRYQAISAQDKADMFGAFRNIRWWLVIPLLIVGFGSHLARAARWRLLMQPLQVHPGLTNTAFAVFIGYLANAAVPRLGEVVKCTILAKYEKVRADKLVGTIIAERAFDLVCLGLLFLLTLLTQLDLLYPYAEELFNRLFRDTEGQLKWPFFSLLLLLGLMAIVLVVYIGKRLKTTPIGKIILGVGDGLKTILQIRERGRFLIYTLLIWLGYTGMIIIGFWAMPEMDGVNLMASLSILTMGSIGMIATPGGIGVYPVIVAEVLTLYAVSSGIGFAYGWISWMGQTLVVLFFGLLSLVLLPIYNRYTQSTNR